MKLLILLLSLSTQAQQLTPDGKHALIPVEQVPHIYQAVKGYERLKVEDDTLRSMVVQSNMAIIKMADDFKVARAERESLMQQRDNALEEALKLQVDAATLRAKSTHWSRNRWLLLGAGALIGGYTSYKLIKN